MKKFNHLFQLLVIAFSLFALTNCLSDPQANENDENATLTTSTIAPAFPGAEGYGAYVSGGRGGKVIYVTTLEDAIPAPEGSLRAAIETRGPRTIMFKVGGTISLVDDLEVKSNYGDLTIAGQSAPGGGICVKDYQVVLRGNNIIVRHMRFRSGELSQKEQMSIRLQNCTNVMIDHCSVSWAIDENLTSNAIYNVTIQNTIVGEGLMEGHPKGEHSMGSLLSGIGGVSIIHSLYTTNKTRNPRIFWALLDFNNSVVYNWGSDVAYSSDGSALFNMRNSILKPGPWTTSGASKRGYKAKNIYQHIYMADNIIYDRKGKIDESLTADNHPMINPYNAAALEEFPDLLEHIIMDSPYPAPPLQNYKNPRTELWDFVMDNVGATLPARDAADERMINNARTLTGDYINSVTGSDHGAGGWPALANGEPELDTDGDGMPDWWEDLHGFDKNDPSDGAMDADGDGYTNLEEYLNGTNPRVAEPDSGIVYEELLALQAEAMALVAEERAKYEVYMNNGQTNTEEEIQRIIALGGITVSPDPATNPETITVSVDGVEIMNLVRINSGEFMMGAPDNESGGDSKYSDKPQHKVILTKNFYMAEVSTTVKQRASIFRTSYNQNNANLPQGTSWTDASNIARILRSVTGHNFKLPTEAQWEYACRAGTTTAFSFGDYITTDQVNFDGRATSEYNPYPGITRGGVIDAKTLPANPWGLYGMHGNGYEFCEDVAARIYTTETVTDPVNTGTSNTHCMRGGGPKSGAIWCRSAARYEYKDIEYYSRLILQLD